MTVTMLDLRDELSVDFAAACAVLAEARLRQEQKDTHANRAAVAECWSQVDAVLDLYLEMSHR
jgi:hypothetical protein